MVRQLKNKSSPYTQIAVRSSDFAGSFDFRQL